MGRQRGTNPRRSTTRSLNLDRVPDTSDTMQSTASEETATPQYKKAEKIPPPFKGEQHDSYVTKSEIGLTWKVAAIIGGVFLTVGVPIVWFASNMNFNIDNLQQDLKEVKSKTDYLKEGSIKQDNRLNNLERAVTDIQSKLKK